MLATKMSKNKIQFLFIVIMTKEKKSSERIESKNVEVSPIAGYYYNRRYRIN